MAPVAVLLAYELAGAGQRTVFVCIAFTTAHCVRVLLALALTSPAGTAQPAASFFVSAALQASFMVNGRRHGGAWVGGWALYQTRVAMLLACDCTLPSFSRPTDCDCTLPEHAHVQVLLTLFIPNGTQGLPMEECQRLLWRHWFWGRGLPVSRQPSKSADARSGGHQGASVSSYGGVAGGTQHSLSVVEQPYGQERGRQQKAPRGGSLAPQRRSG